ncbi:LysE family translocator [Fodinicola feengrottensis]|uniref:LysE family translocator n=1 Tax=Fodinicola feengrottensis TaxID=435914 RepID=A0ABN2HNM2_9ACTN|nr:LysE family translocator [Fodinicola feengrottensis]
MTSLSLVLGFAATAFLIIVVPGPSVLFVVSRAVSYGRRTALVTVLGNAVGVYVVVGAVALGLGALIQASDLVFTAVKLVGAGYLVFLGIRAIRDRRALANAAAMPAEQVRRTDRQAFRAGVWVGFSNPKTFILFGAILPQFVDRTAGQAWLQMLVLGLIAAIIGLAADSAWALAAGAARTWLSGSPKRLTMLGGAGGVTMIGLGVSLAITGRHD